MSNIRGYCDREENSRQFSWLTRIVNWSVRSFSRRGGDGVKVVKGVRGNRYFIALQVLLGIGVGLSLFSLLAAT